MEIEVISLIIEAILFFMGLYIIFFKSYYKEKGKNIATKEDIGKITKLVESVKNQLHFNAESKLSFKIQERDSVVNYYNKYTFWVSYMENLPLPMCDDTEIKQIFSKLELEVIKAKIECDQAHEQMVLFTNNLELAGNSLRLHKKAFEMQTSIMKVMLELKHIGEDFQIMLKNQNNPNLVQDCRDLLESYSALIKKHCSEKNAINEELVPLGSALRSLAHTHLQKILTT